MKYADRHRLPGGAFANRRRRHLDRERPDRSAAGAKHATTPVALRFAVSGDSRNCGDVVMPGIAAQVIADQSAFYWHLGDFRAIYTFDEDIQHQPEHLDKPMTLAEYQRMAWPDFLENQIVPFGSVPVFLGIGNHETISPKTRDELIPQIADWLDAPFAPRTAPSR